MRDACICSVAQCSEFCLWKGHPNYIYSTLLQDGEGSDKKKVAPSSLVVTVGLHLFCEPLHYRMQQSNLHVANAYLRESAT